MLFLTLLFTPALIAQSSLTSAVTLDGQPILDQTSISVIPTQPSYVIASGARIHGEYSLSIDDGYGRVQAVRILANLNQFDYSGTIQMLENHSYNGIVVMSNFRLLLGPGGPSIGPNNPQGLIAYLAMDVHNLGGASQIDVQYLGTGDNDPTGASFGGWSLYGNEVAVGMVDLAVNEGNVGIGTMTPAAKLEVNGNAKVDGNFVYVGPQDGAIFGDGSNTVIQAPAGGSVYLARVGIDGTHIQSDGSVKIGGSAQAAARLIFPDGSSISSASAVNVNTGGSYNYNGTPIIRIAGRSGGESQFYGLYVGPTASTFSGINNFLFGVDSGLSFTTGSYNTGFGDYNFQPTTTGSNNAAMGPGALQGLVSGSYNVGMGNYALGQLASGSNNVGIGNFAGVSNAPNPISNISGSNDTFIGSGSVPLTNNDSNEIVIGSNAVGLGSNTTVIGTTSNTTTALFGNIGIGTQTPSATLEVNGNLKLTQGSGASMQYPDGTTQATAWNGTTLGGDYAEAVDVLGSRAAYEPGDVIVIDPTAPGKFIKNNAPYSRMVAGVYSTKPGLVGRRTTFVRPNKEAEVPMAMIGIVPTKVSTENGSIEPGDLLVSAATPGYAMKGTDSSRMMGAVIGKALAPLKSETGVIEVLVSLQ